MAGIGKAYGKTVALSNVSLNLKPGQVHGLMGENGAGKSTLMKILAGVVHPDVGTVLKQGQPIKLRGPRDALEQGISTVFQELSLLPNLTIAENMFLGKELRGTLGGMNRREMEKQAEAALIELGMYLSPRTMVSQLSVAQQQFVEIARGISANADVVILDEPTAALNAADVHLLNKHITRLKEQNKAIVYISHRMEEIFEVCDVVTVLKDGCLVGEKLIGELTPKTLISMMVGRDLGDLFPPRASGPLGDIALQMKGVKLKETTQPVDLTVRKGEIVALAGLEGQGQRDIARAIVGMVQPYAGELSVHGNPIEAPVSHVAGVRRMQARNVGFVPEDRKVEGLFLNLSIEHNLSIAKRALRAGFKIDSSHREKVLEIVSRMAIKAGSVESAVGTLSGGNQQKVLLGRYFVLGAQLLVIEEPTRGVDVGSKLEIYKLLREFTNAGGAVLVLSRETIELIGLCDRLYVIHGSRVVREMKAIDATEHDIVDAAMTAQ
jgi:ribose transport system ATP-binding protein